MGSDTSIREIPMARFSSSTSSRLSERVRLFLICYKDGTSKRT